VERQGLETAGCGHRASLPTRPPLPPNPAGHATYIVGGAVRDALLCARPKDWDVVTGADGAAVAALFPRRALCVGARHPVVLVRPPTGRAFGPRTTEVSFLGGAGAAAAGLAAGAGVPAAAALAASAAGRDFTVNALFYDPITKGVHDPLGVGVADARARVLRSVGRARASLDADPGRVLRAARLAARCKLTLDPDLDRAAAGAAAGVAALNRGRVSAEVAASLAHGAARPTLALYARWGLLDVLLPPLARVGGAPAWRGRRAEPGAGPGWAAIDALDAAATLPAPAPTAVWAFAVAAPLVAARVADAVARGPSPSDLPADAFVIGAVRTALDEVGGPMAVVPRAARGAAAARAASHLRRAAGDDRWTPVFDGVHQWRGELVAAGWGRGGCGQVARRAGAPASAAHAESPPKAGTGAAATSTAAVIAATVAAFYAAQT